MKTFFFFFFLLNKLVLLRLRVMMTKITCEYLRRKARFNPLQVIWPLPVFFYCEASKGQKVGRWGQWVCWHGDGDQSILIRVMKCVCFFFLLTTSSVPPADLRGGRDPHSERERHPHQRDPEWIRDQRFPCYPILFIHIWIRAFERSTRNAEGEEDAAERMRHSCGPDEGHRWGKRSTQPLITQHSLINNEGN